MSPNQKVSDSKPSARDIGVASGSQAREKGTTIASCMQTMTVQHSKANRAGEEGSKARQP